MPQRHRAMETYLGAAEIGSSETVPGILELTTSTLMIQWIALYRTLLYLFECGIAEFLGEFPFCLRASVATHLR